jgi:hypothetical protein
MFDLIGDIHGHAKALQRLLTELGYSNKKDGIYRHPERTAIFLGDFIGGAIKANLPTRVALRVASAIESRIVEVPGAELLLGNGDLLFKSIGPPIRLQGIRSGAA